MAASISSAPIVRNGLISMPPRRKKRPRFGPDADPDPAALQLGVLDAVKLTADSADWHARERGLAGLERCSVREALALHESARG